VAALPERDRLAVEAALPASVRAALPELCKAWGVRDVEWWSAHPVLGDVLPLVAVLVRRKHYESKAHSPTRALALACADLGLSLEAVRSRLKRTRKAYLDARAKVGAKCPPRCPRAAPVSKQKPQPVEAPC
jgi:hypothetical protein